MAIIITILFTPVLFAMELAVPVTTLAIAEEATLTAQALQAAKWGFDIGMTARVLSSPNHRNIRDIAGLALGECFCHITDSMIFGETQKGLASCTTKADGQKFIQSFETYLSTPGLPSSAINQTINNIDTCLAKAHEGYKTHPVQTAMQCTILETCRDLAREKLGLTVSMQSAFLTQVDTFKASLSGQNLAQTVETFKQVATEHSALQIRIDFFDTQIKRAEHFVQHGDKKYLPLVDSCQKESALLADPARLAQAKFSLTQNQIAQLYQRELSPKTVAEVQKALRVNIANKMSLEAQLQNAKQAYQEVMWKALREDWTPAKIASSELSSLQDKLAEVQATLALEEKKIEIAGRVLEQQAFQEQASTIVQATQLSEKYLGDVGINQKAQQLVALSEATLDMVKTMPQNITSIAKHGQAERVIEYARQFGIGATEGVGDVIRCTEQFGIGTKDGAVEMAQFVGQSAKTVGKATLHPVQTWQQFERMLQTLDAQEKKFSSHFTGDFSKVNELLAEEAAQVKEYYTRLAEHYRTENLGVVPITEKDVEKFVYREILKDRANSEFWKQIKGMSAEQIAHAAGKEVAQCIIGEGAFRIARGAALIGRIECQLLKHGFKEGVGILAQTAIEKTTQAAGKIAQVTEKIGQAVAEVTTAGEEVVVAGADGAFKAAIRNPGIRQACEKISTNLPKMEIVKDAGIAGTRQIIRVNNMKEFFSQHNFGKTLEPFLEKTKKLYDGQAIYRVRETVNGDLKKGYHVYLDALHKDHLEVFNKNGSFITVLNLDGTINSSKALAAAKAGRSISGLL